MKHLLLSVIFTLTVVAVNAQTAITMHAVETPLSIELANVTVLPIKGSRVVVETYVNLPSGQTALTVIEDVKPRFVTENGVTRMVVNRDTVNNKVVEVSYRIYIPKTIQIAK